MVQLNEFSPMARCQNRRRISTSTVRRSSVQTPTGALQPDETYSPHSVYQQHHDPFLESGNPDDRFMEDRRMHDVMTTFDYTNQVWYRSYLSLHSNTLRKVLLSSTIHPEPDIFLDDPNLPTAKLVNSRIPKGVYLS